MRLAAIALRSGGYFLAVPVRDDPWGAMTRRDVQAVHGEKPQITVPSGITPFLGTSTIPSRM